MAVMLRSFGRMIQAAKVYKGLTATLRANEDSTFNAILMSVFVLLMHDDRKALLRTF